MQRISGIDFTKEIPLTQRFGMCLLDHEQLVKDRIKHLNHILKHTDTVVIHDADIVQSFNFLHKPHTIQMHKHLTPNTAVIRTLNLFGQVYTSNCGLLNGID